MLYDVTKFERALLKYQRNSKYQLREVEREGEKKHEGFSRFTDDVFHRLFSSEPKRNDGDVPVGAEVFDRLHDAIGQVPEFNDLRERCIGDDDYSAIASSCLIEQLIENALPDSGERTELTEDEEAAVDLLEEMLADAAQKGDTGVAGDLQESWAEVQDEIKRKAKIGRDAADMLDDRDIRNAVREAVQRADKEISEQSEMVSGWLVGRGPGVTREERKAVSRRLAEHAKNAEAIKRIGEIAGRLSRIARNKQAQKAKAGIDQLSGYEIGNDLSRVVPAELAFAASSDPAMRAIFFKRFTERGLTLKKYDREQKKEQGPIVMMIDCSGSMNGERQTWAGAVALAFAEIAHEQHRDLCIQYFNNDIVREHALEYNGKGFDTRDLIDAVSPPQPSGGTSFTRALGSAQMTILSCETMSNADIIFITDGDGYIDDPGSLLKNKEEIGYSIYSVVVEAETSRDLKTISDLAINLSDLADDSAMHKLFEEV